MKAIRSFFGSFRRKPESRLFRHPSENRAQPHNLDTVFQRYDERCPFLDARVRRHDELSLRFNGIWAPRKKKSI
jgi:hypothetical protein